MKIKKKTEKCHCLLDLSTIDRFNSNGDHFQEIDSLIDKYILNEIAT